MIVDKSPWNIRQFDFLAAIEYLCYGKEKYKNKFHLWTDLLYL